jgi:hypothetical protein
MPGGYVGVVTLRGLGTASLIAAFLVLLVPMGSQHSIAVAASTSALALLTTVGLTWCAVLVLCTGATKAEQGAASARSTLRETAFLPQRDPDAAGKPRPRAPGKNLSLV